MRANETPLLLEIPMKLKLNSWTGSFDLKDKNARLILLRFVSGDNIDDNRENVWDWFVYGADQLPLRDAHLTRGSMLRGSGFQNFKHQKDVEGAKKEFLLEKEMFPDNISATLNLWSIWGREDSSEEMKQKITAELRTLFDLHQQDEEKVAMLLPWLEKLESKEKMIEIKYSFIEKSPKGKIAEAARTTEIYQEKDAAKRIDLIKKFFSEFQLKDQTKENFQSTLVNAYVQNKQYKEAIALLTSLPKASGNMYNSIAWSLIEKGEQLEQATALAKKGVELLRKPNLTAKPSYLSAKDWKANNETSLGMILDTYAYGLFQMNKFKDAERTYEEAYKLMHGSDPEVNERTIACYVKNERFQKAYDVSIECIKSGKSNEALLEHFKTAYQKIKGTTDGYEKAITDARTFARNQVRDKLLKERVNKPAIDFELKSLDGKMVRLSELRGKVVVVDFWATWCGPCKASFPFLQKIVEKYKDNPNVMILALDTWENVKGEERETLVKKFIEDNKYTFTVLFDDAFVDKYGVSGIPTKFIIDREGNIQFKSIGFGGGDTMIDEMTIEIDMLLSDDFYSMK